MSKGFSLFKRGAAASLATMSTSQREYMVYLLDIHVRGIIVCHWYT